MPRSQLPAICSWLFLWLLVPLVFYPLSCGDCGVWALQLRRCVLGGRGDTWASFRANIWDEADGRPRRPPVQTSDLLMDPNGWSNGWSIRITIGHPQVTHRSPRLSADQMIQMIQMIQVIHGNHCRKPARVAMGSDTVETCGDLQMRSYGSCRLMRLRCIENMSWTLLSWLYWFRSSVKVLEKWPAWASLSCCAWPGPCALMHP